MPRYQVTVDGRTFVLEGDHPPSESEARQAIGAHQPEPPPVGNEDHRGYLEAIKDRFLGSVKHIAGTVADHPVQAGAIIGGMAAAPLTGGASIPASMAAAGLGAAGGAGLGSIVNAARGGENGPHTATDVLSTMGKEGALGAAGEGTGQIASKGLRIVGRGLYRAAALPINKFNKYGDLISKGLENSVPVSKSGLDQAGNILDEAAAKKAAALADADQRVTLRTGSVSADAGANLQGHAARLKRAGLEDPTTAFEDRLTAFDKNNPAYMPPSELEGVKHTLDNTVGGAYRKLKMREPLTPSEQYGVEMTQAQSRALEDVVPGYKQMNRDKMNAEGLRQMISRRVSPNGSGGNQGLENAMTMLGGIHAIPARLAMLPPVLSRVAIGAHAVGQSPLTADAVRSALLALFGGQ